MSPIALSDTFLSCTCECGAFILNIPQRGNSWHVVHTYPIDVIYVPGSALTLSSNPNNYRVLVVCVWVLKTLLLYMGCVDDT